MTWILVSSCNVQWYLSLCSKANHIKLSPLRFENNGILAISYGLSIWNIKNSNQQEKSVLFFSSRSMFSLLLSQDSSQYFNWASSRQCILGLINF